MASKKTRASQATPVRHRGAAKVGSEKDQHGGIEGNGERRNGSSLALAIAKEGNVRTSRDYAKLMAALMCDAITGSLTPSQIKAAVGAGQNMLRLAELELKSRIVGDKEEVAAPALRLC